MRPRTSRRLRPRCSRYAAQIKHGRAEGYLRYGVVRIRALAQSASGQPEVAPSTPREHRFISAQTFRRMFQKTGLGGREKSSRSAGSMAFAILRSQQSTRKEPAPRSQTLPHSSVDLRPNNWKIVGVGELPAVVVLAALAMRHTQNTEKPKGIRDMVWYELGR